MKQLALHYRQPIIIMGEWSPGALLEELLDRAPAFVSYDPYSDYRHERVFALGLTEYCDSYEGSNIIRKLVKKHLGTNFEFLYQHESRAFTLWTRKAQNVGPDEWWNELDPVIQAWDKANKSED